MIAKNIQKNRRKIMVTIDDAIGLAVDTCFLFFHLNVGIHYTSLFGFFCFQQSVHIFLSTYS